MSNRVLIDEWIKREWSVRDQRDLDVIDEVVTRDMYAFRAYVESHPAPSLVLDIGAHIGTFTVLAKLFWPDTPVIAFEPNPASFELLRENADIWMDATLVDAGVSYGERPDLVYVDSIKSTGSGFLIERDKAQEAIGWKDGADHMGYSVTEEWMRTVTLEEYATGDYPNGVFMKLDAELAEVNILNGMSAELASKIIRIVGEYHCEGGWGEFLERVDARKFPRLTFHSLAEDLMQPIGLFHAI